MSWICSNCNTINSDEYLACAGCNQSSPRWSGPPPLPEDEMSKAQRDAAMPGRVTFVPATDTQRRYVIESTKQLIAAKVEAARLQGYIDRVRETEVPQGNPVRTAANLNAAEMIRGLREMNSKDFESMVKDLPTERIDWMMKAAERDQPTFRPEPGAKWGEQ